MRQLEERYAMHLPPIVPHASMGTDLLEPLKIITELRIQVGRSKLIELSIDTVFLSV